MHIAPSRHKKDCVSSLLNNPEIHILGLSETKLDGYVSDGELSIPAYGLLRKNRTEHGGGVALYVAAHLHIDRNDDIDDNEIESTWIRVSLRILSFSCFPLQCSTLFSFLHFTTH